MWPMIAEPNLRCQECHHDILPGRLCLSELPEETPAGVTRKDFKNYCIGCPKCWAEGKHACYVRQLDSASTNGRTPRSLPCARCGQRIGAGENASVELYYEWNGQAEDEPTNPLTKKDIASLTSAAQVGTILRGIPDGSFANLTDGLQRKFMDADLRPEHGTRTLLEAQGFYKDSVPLMVRNYGEETVRQFLQGKDASHITSVHNAPEMATQNSNMMWEASKLNRARSAADMGGLSQLTAQSTNVFDASQIVIRQCANAAASAALIAAILEAPVSALENYIKYKKGHKTGEQAIKDAANSIAANAATGAIVGIGLNIAIGLGAGPLIATASPILMPVGITLLTYSALKRIVKALDEGLPLHRVATYFCSSRCHTRFAYDSGLSALIRWDSTRAAAPFPKT